MQIHDTRYKIQDIWPMGQFLWQGKLIPAFVHALRLIAWPGYKLKHTHTHLTLKHTLAHHTHWHTQLQAVATHRLASSSLTIAAHCTSQREGRKTVSRGVAWQGKGVKVTLKKQTNFGNVSSRFLVANANATRAWQTRRIF